MLYEVVLSYEPLKFQYKVRCVFAIAAGEILATTDLSSHTVPGFDLYIYVYDGKTLVGPRTLTVIISGKTQDFIFRHRCFLCYLFTCLF